MLRIRFHGRGGQGMKTASRIVGTAAFRQGFYAQDSPVYGAERRGAPMVAFTRFADHPILERGFVTNPNLVVIADESLLGDPLVRPTQGLLRSGTVLVNSRREPAEFGSRYSIPNAVASADFTSLALHHTGSVVALSVAVGAAAAKLAGMEGRFVETAVREELEALALDPKRVEKNLELASASCDAVIAMSPSGIDSSESSDVERSIKLVTPVYCGGWAGTASVAAAPNTPLRRTGDWRVSRPIIDLDRCTHCWICFVNCPDGAIALSSNDVPNIDYGVCKGCMLCAEECPVDAIESVREAEAP
jgi:pyruvate ferredoxin oxidoreductase gamma subunit